MVQSGKQAISPKADNLKKPDKHCTMYASLLDQRSTKSQFHIEVNNEYNLFCSRKLIRQHLNETSLNPL